MANWIDIGPASESAEAGKNCVSAEGKPLVVCHVKGQWHCVLNVCPHAGLPLGEGELRGTILTCPFHGYAYDVRTGVNIDFPQEEAPVRTFEVKVESDRVMINMEIDS